MNASRSEIPPIVIRAAEMEYEELYHSYWDADKQAYRPKEENARLQVQLWYTREVDNKTYEADLLRNPHACVLLSVAQSYARERILRDACHHGLQALHIARQTLSRSPILERACEQLQQAIQMSDTGREKSRARYRRMRGEPPNQRTSSP